MSEMTETELDELLRREFSGPAADEGFSRRVLRALPARRRQRPWLLPVSALLGVVLACLALLPAPLLQQVTLEWQAGAFGSAAAVFCVLLLGMSLLGCGWALEESA